jgi:hypothetical protein
MITDGEKTYNSWEDFGNSILAKLPEKRQRVKWWRLHKPWLTGWVDYMYNDDKRHVIFRNLPHIRYSRSWVGYLHIHLYLFNRWSILFTFGDYKFDN